MVLRPNSSRGLLIRLYTRAAALADGRVASLTRPFALNHVQDFYRNTLQIFPVRRSRYILSL